METAVGSPSRLETKILLLSELHESPLNPRKHYDEKALRELADNIGKVGILSPLIVRPSTAPGHLAMDGYEIGAGHRRYRAARLANLQEVPCIIRHLDDREFLELVTVENLQREDVHALDEGEGYRTLMRQAGYDIDTVAAKIGKSKSYIYQRLKLAEMVPKAKEAFLADKITAGHAILIARLQPKDQEEALKTITQRVEMSVRGLAEWIERCVHLDLASAPWDKADKTLVPPAGDCVTCPKRTGFSPELFPDIKKKDTCTHRACFQAKLTAHGDRIRKDLEAGGEKLLELSGQYSHHGKSALGIPQQQWRDKVKAGSCPSTRMGIIIDQGGDERVGEVFPVCVDARCRVHRPRGYSFAPTPAEKARKEEAEAKQTARTETAKRLHLAIRQKVKAPLPRSILELVARQFFGDIWHELRVEIVKLWGWADGKGIRSAAHDRILATQLPKLSQDDLARLLVDLAVARQLHSSTSNYPGEVNPLRAAAKTYQVNEAAIQAAVRKELAEKRQEKKAREEQRKQKAKQAAKAKPKSKGPGKVQATEKAARPPGDGGNAPAPKQPKAEKAAGSVSPPAKTYSEPTCIECQCTEAKACEGGCSWVELDRKTNAGLCSACAPAKKAKKPKAGKPEIQKAVQPSAPSGEGA